MGRQVTLNQIDSVLDDLSYPVMRTDAAAEFDDVTLRLDDGEENLGRLVSETRSDAFDSMAEIESELRNVLSGGPPEEVNAPVDDR
ncbi:DUF5789 family protein [Halostella litorea]|uniref:DUF5789 family protein n=1 Tax=Halostella litorea TaxID=2528831 RepID=UPI001091BF49|nr:hypothetical protein [Halostella litorea]